MENFKINPSNVRGNLSVVLEDFPPNWLNLINVSTEKLSNGRKKITGETETPWYDERQGLLFENTRISLVLSTDANEAELTEITAQQELLPDFHVNWFVKDADNGILLFEATELADYPLTKDNIGKLPFLEGIDALRALGEFERFTYEIHLSNFVEIDVAHIWRAASTLNLNFGDLLKLDHLNLRGTTGLNPVEKDQPPTKWQKIDLYASASIENLKVNLTFSWSKQADYRVSITPYQESGFHDFAELLSAFKLGDVKNAVIDSKKEIPVLDDIRINQVTADFQRETHALNRIVLFGEVLAFGADFEIRFTYEPQGGISVSVRQRIGSFFSAADVLAGFSGGSIKLPAMARVGDFILQAQFNELNYHFSINIIENWTFSLGATPIEINSLQLRVTKQLSDYELRLRGFMQIGGVDLEIVARDFTGKGTSSWYFETLVAQRTAIHIKDLINDLGELFHFSVPSNIPDFTVHNIGISFDTGSHDFSLQLGVALEKPGLGPFSEGNLFIEINLTKNANGSHNFVMNLSGFITVAGTEFEASAQNIGQKDWAIDLVWDKRETAGIDLTKIMQFFEGDQFQPHADFHKLNKDLLIEHAEFHYQHGDEATSNDTSFLIDLKLRSGENEFEGFLSGVKIDDQWHFLFGVGYDHLDNIPGHLLDSKKMSDFTVKNVWVIVNTSNEALGNWPPLPASIPATVSQQAIKSGLVLLTEMDISQQKAVPGASDVFAGHEHTDVVVLAEIGTRGLQLEAILEGKLQIPTGQGHHITMDEVSLTVNLGTNNSLRLAGTFDLDIDDHRQHLTVSLDVSAEGIVITADNKIDNSGRNANTKGWQPFGLKGMNIDELAFELGIDFVPPSVRIGFEGKMHLDGEKPGHDMLAIVLEFSEPIPNPEYLAIAFDTIKFSQIANLFPGSSSEGHRHISDNLLEIHKFGLVWCEKPIVLPDGTNGRIGFSLHGAVKIMNWGAYFSLEVHPDTGIQGTGEMAPIHIGPLRIFGKGKGVSIKQELIEGDWKDVSNVIVNANNTGTQSLRANPTRMHELVAPGGVSIQFNSATSPYLRMSADVQLFGMDLLDIDIDIEKDRAIFDLFFQIPLIAKFKVVSYLTKEHDFGFSGNFFLGLDININIPFVFGPIHIHVRIGFDVAMTIAKKGEHMDIELKGSFVLMGREITLGELKIEGVPTSLKELPQWILDRIEGKPVPHFSDKIVEASGGNSEDEFSKERERLAIDFLEKAKNWAKFVHDDIEKLKQEAKLSHVEIGNLVKKIYQDIERINSDGDDQVKAIKSAKKNEVDRLQSLMNLTQKTPKDSDKWRLDEIERMKWEMKWLKDDTYELRSKLFDIREQSLREGKKLMTVDNLIAAHPSAKDGYPRRAVEHHMNILSINQEAHELEYEVLQQARNHAQAILDSVNQERFYPLTKLK